MPENKPDKRYGKDKRYTSAFQSAILMVLPRDNGSNALNPTEILKRLGVEKPTMAQRVSMSRSLARLHDRGLVNKYYPGRQLQGHAYGGSYAKA